MGATYLSMQLRTVLLLALAITAFLEVSSPPLLLEALAAQSSQMPRFEDYPVTDTLRGSPAPPRLESAPYGRTYRTRLRDGALKGPNFAGAFTVVMWGCGSPCQVVVVIDANTGQLSSQALRTTHGVDYRKESRLLIADAVRPGDLPGDQCAVCGIEAAYLWEGGRFVPLGKGPHPHLRSSSDF